MDNITRLAQIGQSLWYDNIQRSILTDGSLSRMIREEKIKGVTSNPSIFQKAIANSKDYDLQLKPMSWSGMDAENIFWQLAIDDIRATADLLLPVYEQSEKVDGYVSLEVNPLFAHDTEKTIEEAERLWQQVDRPNLMIKIPATLEGIPAIRKTIARGINVNVTLIFSLERYAAVMESYLAGLEDRKEEGKTLSGIASVASFFVSRVDTKVDNLLLAKRDSGEMTQVAFNNLKGRAAIANTRLAYKQFLNVFISDRFRTLEMAGAQLQRPLWASTSTKKPEYRDVIYVEELIGQSTVNTVPPATLDAFYDHGKVEQTIDKDIDGAVAIFTELSKIGIEISRVTQELEKEGVQAFADSFTQLLGAVETRRVAALAELGHLSGQVADCIRELNTSDFSRRLFEKDPSLWTLDQAGQQEIKVRMNWLTAPTDSKNLVPEVDQLLADCLEEGLSDVVLLGMGGSSLAPEVLSLMHDGEGKGLKLTILDSTDPDQVSSVRESIEIDKTLFIVASKSGTTGEINAFFSYFWEECSRKVGIRTGSHFVAITDPGTRLDAQARELQFRKVINADPQVGGRNSALTAFGLVPAGLIGMDLKIFLDQAKRMQVACSPDIPTQANPGIVLGAVLGIAAKSGRDKLTILTDPEWEPFGAWMEQLIAESSGKNGQGILPVANEPELSTTEYGADRYFVYLRSSNQKAAFVQSLLDANQPVITLDVKDAYSLGEQFYLWEIATATACSILGVNSFDQPDVQDAKTRTLKSLEDYKQQGKFEEFPMMKLSEASIYAKLNLQVNSSMTIVEVIHQFLATYLRENDYVAINAFLLRNNEVEASLQNFRKKLVTRYKRATTLGFGPRFLHSTGQLHKGGKNNGVFIIITAQRSKDLVIPGQGVTFGVMQRAQAIGDLHALESKGRRLIWIDLHEPDPDLL